MDIKPFKVKYYLERKDPDFENKMHDVLLVYKQVEMQLDDDGNIIIPDSGHLTHTVSYDEKPGIQAIANKYPDHNPTEENGYVRRDYEYVRLGTLSLLAGIDLLTGEVVPLVSQSHKSSDFIRFLRFSMQNTRRETHPADTGQPLSPYFKGDPEVSRNTAGRPICICIYPDTYLVAEHDRKLL